MLSVVVPIYKEEANIRPFVARAEAVLKKIGMPYEILFCLDPSPDGTQQAVLREIRRNPRIRLIVFSRRFGQPAATLAGLHAAKGDAVVAIDVDLQDPPELIAGMVAKWRQGNDVVYAQRRSRKGETFIKRWVSHIGYRVIQTVSDVPIPKDTGDFRLMSRRVVDQLAGLREHHGFLRGLVAFVGFKQAAILYDRDPRHAGPGNYNRYLGSLRIGMNGLISFSSAPLQFMSLLGFGMAFLGFLLGVWYVVQKLINVPLTPGLSTTVVVVTIFSGVQLLCLGLMGEYVSRIYDEVKQRPLYLVEREFGAGRKAFPAKKGNTHE
jgi:dolichol-phosphate mannosyltransferase